MPIDVHNHVIPPSVIDLVTSDSRFGVTIDKSTWSSRNIGGFPLTDAWFSPEAHLREMDEKGLDRALISAAPKPLYYYEVELEPQALMARTTNQGLAAFAATHPDRMQWLAHVPLRFPETAADELRRAVDLGASGVQIGSSAAQVCLDEPQFDVLWSTIESLNINVFLHPAYEPGDAKYAIDLAQGMPFEVTDALHRLIYSGVFDRHPHFTVVAALGGGFFPYTYGRLAHYASYLPQLAGGPADPLAYVGRIVFDSHVHSVPVLRFLIDLVGADNVVIGTDCSFPSATSEPVAELRAAIDNESAFDRIADTNAERLFWKAAR